MSFNLFALLRLLLPEKLSHHRVITLRWKVYAIAAKVVRTGRFISESGDTLSMSDFYSAAYSETPAHSDDIHKMIIDNPDIRSNNKFRWYS